MNSTASATVKKTTRARKTSVSSDSSPAVKTDSLIKNLKTYEESFVSLIGAINASKEEFSALQKEIAEIKESWVKEQKNRQTAIAENNQQEDIARKRENETYNYETSLARKKAEDEFLEKKAKWERDLEERKDEIAKERQELEILRKQVAGFETEKEKAVKEACGLLQKQLLDTVAADKKLRVQEIKSEKELLSLKITNLTQDNVRQANEIAVLKKSLEEAAAQLKDVAVKVIESSSPPIKIPQTQSV